MGEQSFDQRPFCGSTIYLLNLLNLMRRFTSLFLPKIIVANIFLLFPFFMSSTHRWVLRCEKPVSVNAVVTSYHPAD